MKVYVAVFRVIYVSTPVPGISPLEIRQMVAEASSKNAERDISSFLLHFKGNFLQVLEGEPRNVSALMDRIWNDKRHRDVKILTSDHDSEAHRQSVNHPLTYIDLRKRNGVDPDTGQWVKRGWDYMRQSVDELDMFLTNHDEAMGTLTRSEP